VTRSLPSLSAGSTVRVVAPAGPVDGEALAAGLEVLRSWDLRPVADQNVLARSGYLAGDDPVRGAGLRAAFTEGEGRGAVWYARGGYGTTRLLRNLDLREMSRADRLLVGYSDATALGLALSRKQPFPMLYGPGVAELAAPASDPDLASLRLGLLGGHPRGRQVQDGLRRIRGGRAAGIVLGGCLTLVAALVGTPWLPSLRGRILFLEEVNEEPYRLDRMLTQLAASGVVDGIAGLLLGRFHRCDPRPGHESPAAASVLAEWADGLGVPVLADLQAGHGPAKITIPLGVPAELDADGGAVTFLHG
jgi:muramoyltetrapeptide carboxypeptidase